MHLPLIYYCLGCLFTCTILNEIVVSQLFAYIMCYRPSLQCQGLWYNSSFGWKPKKQPHSMRSRRSWIRTVPRTSWNGQDRMHEYSLTSKYINFCSLHKPREMKTESESSVCGQIRGTQRRVIESILQHKRTRNGSYYQVSKLLIV